jgi:Ca-activated chloride channel family protein
MYFENYIIAPYALVVLLVIAVAFLFFEVRRRRFLDVLCSGEERARRLPTYRPSANVWQFVFFFAALVCLAIALLKPYTGFEMREVSRRGVDIYLLVDLSDSMMAQDIKPSRMERARREIKDFLGLLTGDRVGLIGFAGEAFVFVPLTSDYEAFALFLDELTPDAIPVQGTDIKGAISKALESFHKQSKSTSKAMILITDGEDSVGLDPSATDQIRAEGIKSFVIGVGTPEGAPVPQATGGGYKTGPDGQVVLSRLNEQALQDLALQTGGGYVRSVSGDLDLDQIYRHGIKQAFADQDLAKTQKKLPQYCFQPFLLAAFLLLFLETLMTNRRGYWRERLRLRRPSLSTVAASVLLVCLFFGTAAHATNPFTLESANRDYEAQKYDDALKTYDQLLSQNPEDARLAINRGAVLYRQGKFPEAAQAFKNGLNAKDPAMRQEAMYDLGNALVRDKKLEDALAAYEKAIAMAPDDRKSQLNRDYVKKLLEQQKQDQQKQDDQKKDDQQKQDDQKKDDDQKQDQDKKDQQQDQDKKQDQDKDKDQDQQQKDQQQKDQQDKQDQQNKDDQQKQDQQKQDQGQDQDKDQQQKDQQNDQQNDQDKKDQDGKDGQQQDQKDQEQKDQQSKEDQQKQDQEKQDQQQKDQEKKDQEKKDQQADQDKKQDQQQGQDEKKDGGETAGDDKKDGQPQAGEGESQGKTGEFDKNADQWLGSISDDPSKAVQRLIQQQTTTKPKKFDKDW